MKRYYKPLKRAYLIFVKDLSEDKDKTAISPKDLIL